MAPVLPTELLKIIPRLFDSASDLLSFALVSKKLHSFTLATIKEENKQTTELLDLYVKKIIGVGKTEASIYYILPNQLVHGKVEVWRFQSPVEELKRIANMERQGKQLSYAHSTIKYDEYILTQAAQKQASEYMSKNAMISSVSHMCWGKLQGPTTKYQLNKNTNRNELIYSGGNRNDQMHGEWKEYVDSKLTHVTNYNLGKRHGVEIVYKFGKMATRDHWVMGICVGESERFRPVPKTEHIFLTDRQHYKQGAWDGVQEHWDHLTGFIRFAGTYEAGKRHGPYRVWNNSGCPEIVANYKNDKPDGDYYFYNGANELGNPTVKHSVWENGRRTQIIYQKPGCSSPDDNDDRPEDVN